MLPWSRELAKGSTYATGERFLFLYIAIIYLLSERTIFNNELTSLAPAKALHQNSKLNATLDARLISLDQVLLTSPKAIAKS